VRARACLCVRVRMCVCTHARAFMHTCAHNTSRYEGTWENDAKCGYGLFSYAKGSHRSVVTSHVTRHTSHVTRDAQKRERQLDRRRS